MTHPQTAFLIYGPTAAGKSTVARQLAATLCFVDASLATRRQRVLQRNQQRGDTYSFQITPTKFDAMEHIFERPGADEVRRSQVFCEETTHV